MIGICRVCVLTDLSSEYPLTKSQIEEYHRDGHIHLPSVCTTKEVNVYRHAITATAYSRFPERDAVDVSNRAFLQTLNLRYHSQGVSQFVLAKRFAKIAADLMGVDAVRIYHEQALFKEPNGGITALHKDQYYWPLATDSAMGMWMPLVDTPIEMGPIQFATGSHVDGVMGQYAISDSSQEFFQRFIDEKRYSCWQASMRAGDATFHNGWTMHGATANQTNTMREAMIVTYYPDGTRVGELSNRSRFHDAQNFLGGRKEGDLADSEMNPVLYRS